jgi:uncharacterized protein
MLGVTMRILLAGGRGFLGTPLGLRLAADGHAVVVLTRRDTAGAPAVPGQVTEAHWEPDGPVDVLARVLDGADAVVNLAGESIAARRWSAAHKARIRGSRVPVTRNLAAAIRQATSPPSVLVNASAIGYYGSRGEEVLDEAAAAGSDFLAAVCQEWEQAAMGAAGAARVVLIRTGLVLAEDGGALAELVRPFRLWVGGPLGSGRQYMSWIHRTDWVDLVRWVIHTPAAAGPINATAPNPVTNAEFSRELGRALRRPSWLPAPDLALRLVLGEMADALILSGQRVVPARATALGFRFAYPDLPAALAALFERP